MAIPLHLEEAARKYEEAARRIDQLRQGGSDTSHASRSWLLALTDMVNALADIQTCNNESVHEKLHQLADAMHVRLH